MLLSTGSLTTESKLGTFSEYKTISLFTFPVILVATKPVGSPPYSDRTNFFSASYVGRI